MRIEETRTVAIARPLLWKLIGDPALYPRFISGLTRCERVGRGGPRIGARYLIRMRVGSAQIGGTIELTEFRAGQELAWVGVRGIDQRGRWRLREVEGGTEVTVRVSYSVPGGLLGLVADAVSGPIVAGHLRQTLEALASNS